MLRLLLGAVLCASALAAQAQSAANPFSKAPAPRPAAAVPSPSPGPAPVVSPSAPGPSMPGPLVAPPPPGEPGVVLPPPMPPGYGPAAEGPGGSVLPALQGILGLKKDGPEEEEIRAVRIGIVNGKHIYRGERAYLFESEKDRPVNRRVVSTTVQASTPPPPSADTPSNPEKRPDLPSAVGRPNPR